MFCVTVEIINPQLRRWIGLKPGQERHYDLQVALTHDPITLLHIYTIVQVRRPCSFIGYLLLLAASQLVCQTGS